MKKEIIVSTATGLIVGLLIPAILALLGLFHRESIIHLFGGIAGGDTVHIHVNAPGDNGHRELLLSGRDTKTPGTETINATLRQFYDETKEPDKEPESVRWVIDRVEHK